MREYINRLSRGKFRYDIPDIIQPDDVIIEDVICDTIHNAEFHIQAQDVIKGVVYSDNAKVTVLTPVSYTHLEDEMRARDHSPEELCFYSKGTTDIEFLFPFGWGELWGIADRTDYDLTQHQTVSGEDMSYFDDEAKEKYIPYVIEPSLGADRVTLASVSYTHLDVYKRQVDNNIRTINSCIIVDSFKVCNIDFVNISREYFILTAV